MEVVVPGLGRWAALEYVELINWKIHKVPFARCWGKIIKELALYSTRVCVCVFIFIPNSHVFYIDTDVAHRG